MFDDTSSAALRVSVAGLAARQNAIANNIANIVITKVPPTSIHDRAMILRPLTR
ncbi:MAG TPA: hypothetical protein VFE15_10375 [Marmoricola sp.]|nr:hypothetical protein [Marmoricola sp.]